jgi:hypothetical protein
VRSVTLARTLREDLQADAIAAGLRTTSPETLQRLASWSDLVLVVDLALTPLLPTPWPTWKTAVAQIGPDRWGTAYTPQLANICRAWARQINRLSPQPPPIPTALTSAETETLATLARGRVVLELGSWLGHSTTIMARVAESVWAVDWHHGDAQSGPGDTLSCYLANLESHATGCSQVITVVGRFADVLPRLRPGFGLLFHDGCHDAVAVEADLRAALPLIAPGGTLAVHDWGRYGVEAGITRLGLRPTRLVDSLAIFDYGVDDR